MAPNLQVTYKALIDASCISYVPPLTPLFYVLLTQWMDYAAG